VSFAATATLFTMIVLAYRRDARIKDAALDGRKT
jgi:hypothetical protein